MGLGETNDEERSGTDIGQVTERRNERERRQEGRQAGRRKLAFLPSTFHYWIPKQARSYGD